jgi:hypothetical protein
MIDPNDTDAEAVAREEGRRAAARGAAPAGPLADNPYNKLATAWLAGYAEVDDRRLKGEDRGGHMGSVPHLCRAFSRAIPAVCNCCDGCAQGCTPSTGERLGTLAMRALHKLGIRPRR